MLSYFMFFIYFCGLNKNINLKHKNHEKNFYLTFGACCCSDKL